MLKFTQFGPPPIARRRRSSATDPLPPSPTRTALALGAMTQLFPEASPAFLTWAIQHHLRFGGGADARPVASGGRGGASTMGIQELVDRVGEKVLDGLGELYPRRRPEERLSDDGRSSDRRLAERSRVSGLNDDLLALVQLYPSHPIPFLRSLIVHPQHEPAPLHFASAALLGPLPAGLTPPAPLAPHPVRRTHLDPADRLRTTGYKVAVLAWHEAHYPSVRRSSLRALGAENNWDFARTRAAVNALVETRGFAARLWGGIASSFARFGPASSSAAAVSSSNSGKKNGGVAGGRSQSPWEADEDLANELPNPERDACTRREAADAAIAKRINLDQYLEFGDELGCSCCFGDDAWEEMGACADGHLVCRDCINTHVSVLAPSLTFPDLAAGVLSGPSTLVPCPSCPSPPATACAAEIQLPMLRRHLTPANWTNYERASEEAFSRSLRAKRSDAPRAAPEEVLACPFCPDTTLRAVGFPLVQPFAWDPPAAWSIATLPLAVIAFAFFALATFHARSLPLFLPPAAVADEAEEATIFAPRATIRHTAAYVRDLVRRSAHRLNGATYHCRNPNCGRDSCISCGQEVWDGEGPCLCLASSPPLPSAPSESATSDDEKGAAEAKEKEELRLVVERAMTEAAVRTCPSCELGFMKSDSCNKMTCPRDGYKMCYVCRADVSVDGYAHFCPHFRLVPGPCTECNLCDLYLLPDEDTVIRQAGDKARQAWIKRKRAANLNNDDRGWVNGLRVGPLDERGRRTRDLFHRVDALASDEVARLLRLVGPATSSLDLLLARPQQFLHLLGRNLSAILGILILVVWSGLGTIGVVLAGGLA